MKKYLLLIIALVSFSIASAQQIQNKPLTDKKKSDDFGLFVPPKKPLINFDKIGKFFKYSTFYGVGQISQPITPSNRFYYVTQDNEVVDVTPERKSNYSYGLGIRKVARFDYERKPGVFYDGTEQQQSFYTTVGAVSGWEYKFEYIWNRQFGNEFTNQDFYLRYLGKHFIVKGQMIKDGFVDLEYNSLDLRYRLPVGKKLNFSIGAIARSHRPYGYEPIRDYLETPFVDEFGQERLRQWWELAYEYGFQDNGYGIDTDFDGETDLIDYYWTAPNGQRVADTDADFRANRFGPMVVGPYNREQLALIEDQGTLSAVIGVDFYHYEKNNWLHFSASVLPYHQQLFGDEDFGYALWYGDGTLDYSWLDYSASLATGWKITKNLGVYIESNYTKFWDRKVYSAKAGLNFQFR